MEPDDPDDDKDNICPICRRGFASIAGLRQHVTKSHSQPEIEDAIANKTTSDSQLSQSSPIPEASRATWNKFQIISEATGSSPDKSHQQFDIVETEKSGDCLFSAVLEFLKQPRNGFTNIPTNQNELRTNAVNFITTTVDDEIEQNFTRFKDNIIVNLQLEIPELSNNNMSEEAIQSLYSNYMSTPGKYGTTAELCAMAELFNFAFNVIRENDPKNYTCFDYGSLENRKDRPVLHLLFTGDVRRGHFRYLRPMDEKQFLQIEPGNYWLVNNYTSSRITTIAHEHNRVSFETDKIDSDNETEKGNEESFDDFVLLLARCKKNIRVLKRVPRGARILAARKLTKCIEECLAEPHLDSKWKKLLTFSYATLRVPQKIKNKSLSSMVKANIEKAELIFPKPTKKNEPISLSKRVEYKIAEGNVKGAVKLLSSSDTLAPQSVETFQRLQEKHPPPSRELYFPEPPDKDTQPLVVTEKEVFLSLKSFPNGSAAGIDGILPQHLKDLTLPSTGEAGLKLIKAITDLTNFMLRGKMISKVIEIMYGASLCALNKELGGIRPIAVGNTFRRLAAKLACASVRTNMSSKFAPRQVGFGIRGGCEAAAHATRTFIKKNSNRKAVVLKIDFRNAFNEVDRDKFLMEMKVNCPSIYAFLWQCYSKPTLLFYGDDILLSQNGAQQGDPCGPLLFSSAIQSVVDALLSEFIVFYLDDGTIAGEYDSVLRDFKTVITEVVKIGLQINPTKCEIYFCSEVDQETVRRFEELSPGICVVNELTLLGAPISENATKKVFKKKLNELKVLFQRLDELDNYHIAFYILKNCYSLPKLIFLLRTTPMWKSEESLNEFDLHIKASLESLTNSHLDSETWTLASLPVSGGGLGVRKVRDTALPAFISSVNSVSSLVSFMFNLPAINLEEISDYQDGLNEWNLLHPETDLPKEPWRQNQWTSIMVAKSLRVLQFDGNEERARFLAIQRPEAGAWLHALPSKSIGTLLENNAFRVSVGLRLGLDICTPHTCRCGDWVDKKGRHGLKCRLSAGRHARHAELNTTIKRSLVSADVPAVLEPVGLSREDGKRVDGMTLIPWSRGSALIWDATCADTFAPSNLKFSARQAGGAAEDKARRKTTKYSSLINNNNFLFVPFSVETMGPWSTEAMNFFNILSKMIAVKTNEPRSRTFLQQRLSMAIQRGNAAAVMGIFRTTDKMEEIFYLL